jgi:tetratricopeptide (TPR) repeat protein
MSSSTAGGTRARRAAKGQVPPKPGPPAADDSGEAIAPREASQERAPKRAELDPDVLAALEEQRHFLLRSLDDLEREYAAGDVDDVDYLALKDDYTARAASVLTAIDSRRTIVDTARRPRRWGLIGATVAALVVFGIGAGWLVAASFGVRQPGDTITGNSRTSTINQLAQASASVAEASTAQQAGKSDAAVTAYKNALDSYRKVLDEQPDNTEALTYRGWLLHVLALQASNDIARQLDQDALTSINRAVTVDPTYADARIFRAIIFQRQGRNADAAADLDAVDPAKIPPSMTEMVDGLKSQLQ